MAHTPAASSWRAASWSWTIAPVVCRPKSMTVVVPPHAAAAVPVSKSSDENVPPNGRFMCTCGSIPPGTTYLPVASMVRSAVTPVAAATPGA